MGSTKSAEGATPNRAVRICLRSELAKKGCYIDCFKGMRSEGPTSIIFIRCRTYGAH